jgi:galactokinase
VVRSWAPGRVNLIGEHVDYVGGLVLPAALERGITVTGRATGDGVVRLTTGTFEGEARIRVDTPESERREGWARYVAAVVGELADLGVVPPGFEGTVESDLPAGSGLSSSAALEVALAAAFAAAAQAPLAGLELALLGQRAELRAVGVPCGIMDQAASALGVRDHALLLDCATLDHRSVPLPDDLGLVVIDSGVRRRLEDSAYAARRAEIETALAALPAGSARGEPEAVLSLATRTGLDRAALRRLRHVVTENRRVERVVAALERVGGADLGDVGRLFDEGHASLRDDFEVSTPELDLLVRLAREEGASAARMTGGGFGGAIVALAPLASAETLARRTAERYTSATGREATVLVGRAGPGAVVEQPS